jgi:hypothetical protein
MKIQMLKGGVGRERTGGKKRKEMARKTIRLSLDYKQVQIKGK